MNFDALKNIGGIGAILIFAGFLLPIASAYTSVISLVGIIMLLISLSGFATYYKNPGIFKYFLWCLS
jgi:uncharacterized membrane protein